MDEGNLDGIVHRNATATRYEYRDTANYDCVLLLIITLPRSLFAEYNAKEIRTPQSTRMKYMRLAARA